MASIKTILNLTPIVKTQKFTASGTFTVPANVYTLVVTMCGGGGGSATSSSSFDYYGAGGSGGFYLNTPISVSPSDSLTITVGAAGTSSFFNGTTTIGTIASGGNSSIYVGATELLTAYGGQAGTRGSGTTAGDGGAPNGSGGAAGFTSNVGSSGSYMVRTGGPGARLAATVRGGGYERDPFFGIVCLGVGKYANGYLGQGNTYLAQAASPIPGAGAGAPGAMTTPINAEPGVVILTWIEQ